MKWSFKFTIIVLLLNLNVFLYPQWTPVNAPNGSPILCGLYDNDSLYIVNQRSFPSINHTLELSASYDSGNNWNKLYEFNGLSIKAITKYRNIMCLLSDNKTLLISLDKGLTWNNYQTNCDSISQINSIIIDNEFIYAINSAKTWVARVKIGETQWENISSSLTGQTFYSMTYLDSTLFIGTSQGLFLSKDKGINWAKETTILDAVNSIAHHQNSICAVTYSNFFISSDKGKNWLNTVNKYQVSGCCIKEKMIYIVDKHDSIYSINAVTSSNKNITGEFGYITFPTILCCGNNLIVGSMYGAYVSTDNGFSWINKGPGYRIINSLASTNNIICAATNENYNMANSGIYLSGDNSKTWTLQLGFLPSAIKHLAAKNNLLVGGSEGNYNNYNGGAYFSEDYGRSWEIAFYNKAVSYVDIIGDSIFVYADGKLFFSNNHGAEWNQINLNNIKSYITKVILIGDKLYLGTGAGVFSKSINDTIWTQRGLSNYHISDLLFYDNYKLFAATREAGIFCLKNNGADWQSINSKQADYNIYNLLKYGDNIFAGTYNKGIFSFSDDGNILKHWFGDKTINAMCVAGENLFVALETGEVFMGNADLITNLKKESLFINDFMLMQNYPNPFNPSTVISYLLPDDCFVNLKISNSLGQEIKSLVNNIQPSGINKVQFYSKGLASGIYFYSIHAVSKNGLNTYNSVKKMLILK